MNCKLNHWQNRPGYQRKIKRTERKANKYWKGTNYPVLLSRKYSWPLGKHGTTLSLWSLPLKVCSNTTRVNRSTGFLGSCPDLLRQSNSRKEMLATRHQVTSHSASFRASVQITARLQLIAFFSTKSSVQTLWSVQLGSGLRWLCSWPPVGRRQDAAKCPTGTGQSRYRTTHAEVETPQHRRYLHLL